jgi:hypothetical protein
MSIFSVTDAVFTGLVRVLGLVNPSEHESSAERIVNHIHSDIDDFIASLRIPVVNRLIGKGRRGGSAARARPRRPPRLPSLSRGIVGLAKRRLPKQMSEPERQRWGDEMMADVAATARQRRLIVAFNIWRKGAPGIPATVGAVPRSIGD